MLNPLTLRILLVVLLLTVLSACAPSANIAMTQPFMKTWSGPIETLAIVMNPPSSSIRALAESTYNLSQVTLARHPYARQRFDLIERQALNQVLNELRLSTSGLVDAGTAPEIGRLLGAKYMIVVDLLTADVRESRVRGIHIEGIGTLGGSGADVSVSLSMRLVDVQTGRVIATGSSYVTTSVMTGFSLDSLDFSSSVSRELALDLVPEAAMRALNDLFSRIG